MTTAQASAILYDVSSACLVIVAAMCVTGVIINEGGWKERIALAGIGALAFGMALL